MKKEFSSKHAIIIVHPFTSIDFLYSAIRERNTYTIVTLITKFDSKWIENCRKTIEENSDFIIHATNDLNTDINTLTHFFNERQLKLVGIINALDASLEYSDELANHFLKSDIDIAYSKMRCNKHQVHADLFRNSTIPIMKTALFSRDDDWQKLRCDLTNFKFPLVIKPSKNSAGRNSIAIANNIDEVKLHLTGLFTQKSIFLTEEHACFVIQEYIEGQEFVVNSSAIGNTHKIAGLFKYVAEGNKLLQDVTLSHEDSPEQINQLIDYHNRCMKHLRFTYGMVHAEYIIDHTGQPYLIEINNRLSGAGAPFYSNACYHSDEVNLFLDMIENKNEIPEFNLQNIFGFAAMMFLYNYTNPDATRLNLTDIDPSHYKLTSFKHGVVKTSNREAGELFDNYSAIVWLFNHDLSSLNKEVRYIRDLDRRGLLFV